MHLRTWLRKQHQRLRRRSVDKRFRARRQSWRRWELLEPRLVLEGPGIADYGQVTPAWFGQVPSLVFGPQPREVRTLSAAIGSDGGAVEVAGNVAQWIVRLTPDATAQAGSVPGVKPLLDTAQADFQVLRGLGLPGQVLVRSTAATDQTNPTDSSDPIRAALAANPNVATFEPDRVVSAQVLSNDPDFQSMTDLHNVGQFGATPDADIDAPEAWDMNTGSTNVVVGVIDSGIDVTHPDLYLNIWLNQGEIPASFKSQLIDTDGDGRISFYDLNAAANASFVTDTNGNTYIDAQDLLDDSRWGDGLDTDKNGFVDDFFGWNFRVAANEPFAPNDPRDALGHGTHVAGTIGAIGNNGRGVSGINWRSSLMALKFLDDSNQGLTSDAVAAVNYATMMRTEFGENVRVLNASWGQSGGPNAALQTAIEVSGEAGLLFVAAAGNGNILGQGIDIDREPFYPASYDLDNILSVAATGPNDELARFSNYGATSVDLAAPGVGVLSTLPGGRYGSSNGTSMAAPHVAGTATLIWSELPDATLMEVQQAILSAADTRSELVGSTVSGARLNAYQALISQAFAPRARLVTAANITVAGGTDNVITVLYTDRNGVDETSLGDRDLLVTRQWGPREQLSTTLVSGSVVVANGGAEVTASYLVSAPGGTWDPFDYGPYEISVGASEVRSRHGASVPVGPIGAFSVRMGDASVIYVDTFEDAVDANVGDGVCVTASGKCTLRAAIQEANAAKPAARTIALKAGKFRLSILPEPDPQVTFPVPASCVADGRPRTWSSERTGDLDILGNVAIVGDDAATTIVDAAGSDRVFRVYPGATLDLRRVRVTGGRVTDAGGAGILSLGTLKLDHVVVDNNVADAGSIFGGGIAIWGGVAELVDTTISDNRATSGGGLFVGNQAAVRLLRSTLMSNTVASAGGGIYSFGGSVEIVNGTLAQNNALADGGAVYAFSEARASGAVSVSADGRFVAFESDASNRVPGDTNNSTDIFVADHQNGTVERISVAADGTQGDSTSTHPAISADGRFVAFESYASNLVPGDTWDTADIFVFDRENRTLERITTAADVAGKSYKPAISADGRFVAFESAASTVVPGDTNGWLDVFVFDRQERSLERVSVGTDGTPGDEDSYSPRLSADGRFVVFESLASNLVPGDTNDARDVFVCDRQTRSVERVSEAADGTSGDWNSARPAISADGRFVAFYSFASNLVPDDSNDEENVFLCDRRERTMERVSVVSHQENGGGKKGGKDPIPYGAPSLSADGRILAFDSDFETGQLQTYVFDQQAGTISQISTAADGTEGNGRSFARSLSADGRFVVVDSAAANLVPGVTDGLQHVFIFDRQSSTTECVTPSLVMPSAAVFEHVTVAENRTTAGAAVVGSVRIHNVLFADNLNVTAGVPDDIGWGVESAGYNLLESVDQFFFSYFAAQIGDQIDRFAPKLLGPLQANGGVTWTYALLPGSPAIDVADPADDAVEDQRGVVRPQDGDGALGARTDVGAFEAFAGEIWGTIFQDLDRDGRRDTNEPGLTDQFVYLDADKNGRYDLGEPAATTQADDSLTTNVVEQGLYSFSALAPGSYWAAVNLLPGWSQTTAGIEMVDRTATGGPGGGQSFSPALSADGRFVAFEGGSANLIPGDTNNAYDIVVSDRQTDTLELVSLDDHGNQANGSSSNPSISADGRFVAFTSSASNLVPEDTNGVYDVFVYDRQKRTVELVSVATDGTRGNGWSGQSWSDRPSISANGRFIAFSSRATNLFPGDTNNAPDAFVRDRQNGTLERISMAADGMPSSGGGDSPVLSADGRFVAFVSGAPLVTTDTNGAANVFVFDRQNRSLELVSAAADGTLSNGGSGYPAISADGRFVAFTSDASNLLPGDTNGQGDVFVRDRHSGTLERLSVANDGTQANAWSTLPSISGDGRFVAFYSLASNLVPGDTNGFTDTFVCDRQDHTLERVSVAADGSQGNGNTGFTSLSADGRFVAFQTDASNLVPNDLDGWEDAFIVPNRKTTAVDAIVVGLYAGQVLTNVDFGLAPNPGEIRGRIFEDVIADGVYDAGEPERQGSTVYLDTNGNGRLDAGEPATQTAADGIFVFSQLASYRDYQVGVIVPDGFTLVLPTAAEQGVWKVFLPAGGSVTDRDFGIRRAQTGGQFENAVVSGRVFADGNGNGRQDAGESGLSDVTVFLDANDDRVRQFNEPRAVSAADDPNTPTVDESGQYVFANLGNRPYTVRVLEVPHYQQLSPVGNHFEKQVYSLAAPGSQLGSPQDVAVGDFNRDGAGDLAVAVFDRNAVSLLLNDRNGAFPQPPLEISLAPSGRPTTAPRGVGPIAILAGDFNGQGGADLAVVNNLSSNVTILLDFDGSHFASETYVTVGTLPNSVAGADLDGDGNLDLVVTNEWNNTVSILRNDGQGRFTADIAAPATGNRPFGVASGDFNEDGRLDLVVADFGMYPQGGDLGNVRVLLAGSNGAFQSQVACSVGFGPSAIVARDLNGDGHLDLAVANFLSDNVTVCRGLGNGTFQAVATLSGGSGPMDLDAADIDGDGDLDLLVTSGKSQKVGILRNRLSQGIFEFAPAESFGVANFLGASQISLATGDLDHNGTTDLAIANSTDNSVAVHLNRLLGGAQRLGLTGVETVTGVDFGFRLVNSVPTLDPLGNPGSLNEDAGPQTITLGGITAGAGETQVLRVTVGSSNAALISTVTVNYTSPAATGTLTFTPTADQFGQTVITVTVTDGGLDNDLATPDDNAATSQSFTVTVLSLNDPPTLDALPTVLTLDEDAPQQTVSLAGITAGGGESQPLRVTATTSDAQLLPDLSATYSSPATTATLRFTPAAHRSGSALITVTVTDGGLDGDLATVADNASLSRVMAVVVRAVSRPPTLDAIGNATLDEDATEQVVTLTGITTGGDGDQPLRVTVGSDSTTLIPTPTVVYTSPATSGQLKFRPAADRSGQTIITVTVTDGGLDGDLATTGDNGSFVQSFTVTVQAVNDPPLARNDELSTDEDTLLEIPWSTLFQNDSDVDSPRAGWTMAAVGSATHGAVANDSSNQRVTFQPEADFHGRDHFTYTLDDGQGGQSTATVGIEVASVNDRPTAVVLAPATVSENAVGALIGMLTASDQDVGDTYQLTVSDGRFEILGGRLLKLRAGQSLDCEAEPTVRMNVTARDAGGLELTQAVVVTVTDVNEFAPVLDDATFNVAENIAAGTVVGTVSATDGDATHGGFAYRITGGNGLGIFGVDDTGRITVVDPNNLTQSAISQLVLTVQVSDGGPGDARTDTAQVTFTLTVTANPHPWQNPRLACDVDQDGTVAALDVLVLISELNNPTIRRPDGSLPAARAADSLAPFFDPNGDGQLQPIDVLLVINYINNPPKIAAEGEAAGAAALRLRAIATPAAPTVPTDTALRGLAANLFAIRWASNRLAAENSARTPQELAPAPAISTAATVPGDRIASRALFSRHAERWFEDWENVLADLAEDVARLG
ncbi:MAG: S8 family serine peptidase [Planctomycetota bacterium]|nr:S8 family serine peptidase [Planctomycetota bacterium]